jgi:hypothetical protein
MYVIDMYATQLVIKQMLTLKKNYVDTISLNLWLMKLILIMKQNFDMLK